MEMNKLRVETGKIRQNPRGDWSQKTLESLKKGIIEYEAWTDSGVYIEIEVFNLFYPDNHMYNDCDYMIRYIGELYIGRTKSNTFRVEGMTYTTIKNAQLSLWDKQGKNFSTINNK